jgi:TPR repeat protein
MARMETTTFQSSEVASVGGVPEGLFDLGLVCCSGRETELDLVAAHKWFNLAAMRGNAQAKSYRMEISREMSPAQIAAAQRLAREWLARH